MGLMRKMDAGSQGAAGAKSKDGRSQSPQDARAGKRSKLYVRPNELAGKLVKEMESRKVFRSSGVSVCNLYTVYLCPEDYERLERRQDQICTRLERHLVKYVRGKRYEVVDDIAGEETMVPIHPSQE